MKLIPSAMAKTKATALTIGSTEFGYMDFIPSGFNCEDQNVNPDITIENIPPDTQNPGGIFTYWN